MRLKDWLRAERGRAARLANHLGVTRGRVTQMADGHVPIEHIERVHDFSGGVVSADEMLSQRDRLRLSIIDRAPVDQHAADV